jgi:hypothetical protein
MARWHWNKGGAALETLYERTPFSDYLVAAGQMHPDYRDVPPTTTLADIVDELGLARLSEAEERQLRWDLGAVIAVGMKVFELSAAAGGLQVKGVQATLWRIAKTLAAVGAGSATDDELQEIEQTLHGAETGFHHSLDIASALLITRTLAEETGWNRAHDRMLNFLRWPSTLAAACHKAAKDLDKIKGKNGRPSLEWYRDFQRILTSIAKKNSIPPTVEINRATGKAQGRFIELAKRFEELLPPMLRSPSPEAMAKRLQSKT